MYEETKTRGTPRRRHASTATGTVGSAAAPKATSHPLSENALQVPRLCPGVFAPGGDGRADDSHHDAVALLPPGFVETPGLEVRKSLGGTQRIRDPDPIRSLARPARLPGPESCCRITQVDVRVVPGRQKQRHDDPRTVRGQVGNDVADRGGLDVDRRAQNRPPDSTSDGCDQGSHGLLPLGIPGAVAARNQADPGEGVRVHALAYDRRITLNWDACATGLIVIWSRLMW
jgi:hypothetical protein